MELGRAIRFAAYCFVLAACALFNGCSRSPNAVQQQLHGIFSSDRSDQLEAQRPVGATLRIRRTRLEPGVMDSVEHRAGTKLLFNLFSDAQFEAVADQYKFLGNDTLAWSGHLTTAEGTFTLLRKGPLMSLVLRSPGKAHYAVLPGEEGNNVVYEFDPSKFGECAVTERNVIRSRMPRPGVQPNAINLDQQKNDVAPTTISVLVLYTPAVKKLWGGQSGTELVIDHIVLDTNVAYASSQISQNIVVMKNEIAYTESGNLDDDLKWLHGSTEAAALRNNFKSDLVAMIVDHSNDSTAAGVGYVMGTVDHSFESQAFSVTVAAAARDNYSFAHELAHNMGACHTQDDHKCVGAFPYSFGWRFLAGANKTKLRTIMAYPPGERIGYFSNPDVQYNFVNTGNPDILPNPADNAKTLNNTAATVSHFR